MKRFLSLSLAVLMLLSFAACGESKIVSKKDKTDNTTEAMATETETENTTESGTYPQPTTLPPANTDDVNLGVIGDTYYENEYFGFGVQVPSDWNTCSTSETAALNDTSLSTFENSPESILSTKDFVYAFQSNDTVNNNTVYVSVESLKAKGASGLSAPLYLQNVGNGYVETLNNAGVTDIDKDISIVEINGSIFDYCTLAWEMNGINVIAVFIAIPTEDYMAAISFNVYDADDFGYLEDYIYTL